VKVFLAWKRNFICFGPNYGSLLLRFTLKQKIFLKITKQTENNINQTSVRQSSKRTRENRNENEVKTYVTTFSFRYVSYFLYAPAPLAAASNGWF